MGKPVTKKGSDTAEGDIQRALDVFNAKQKFFTSALNMSWQLALTVVIPVVGGVKLDQRFDSAPSLTLAGFFLAAFAACVVVWNTVRDLNNSQAEEDKKENKGKTRAS